MTFEELNAVRNLKKRYEIEVEKLKALKTCISPTTVKFSRETNKNGESYTCLDVMPKSHTPTSPTENLVLRITDSEDRINALSAQLETEKIKLADKIQAEVTDENEQILLFYRYISCKPFKEIGKAMNVSESHVYFKHRKILKKMLEK